LFCVQSGQIVTSKPGNQPPDQDMGPSVATARYQAIRHLIVLLSLLTANKLPAPISGPVMVEPGMKQAAPRGGLSSILS